MPHVSVIHSEEVPNHCNTDMNGSKEHGCYGEVGFGGDASADHRLNNMCVKASDGDSGVVFMMQLMDVGVERSNMENPVGDGGYEILEDDYECKHFDYCPKGGCFRDIHDIRYADFGLVVEEKRDIGA